MSATFFNILIFIILDNLQAVFISPLLWTDGWKNRKRDGRTEKGMEGRIKEVTYRGGYLKTNKKKKEHQILRMSS